MSWLRRFLPRRHVHKADHPAPRSNKEQKHSSQTRDRVLAIATGLMAVATFVMAFFTYRLASRAAEQVTIYREATHIENRAYIVLKAFDSLKPLNVGDILRVSATLTNVGHTPAYGVSNTTRMAIGATEDVIDTSWARKGESSLVIGSNMDMPVMTSQGFVITKEINDALSAGKLRIFFYVCIRYRDIFGEQHFTSICDWYNMDAHCHVEVERYSGAN